MRGEVLASRGLALVTLGRLAEAKSLASKAAGATTSVETRVLVAAIEAICAMRERTARLEEQRRTVDRYGIRCRRSRPIGRGVSRQRRSSRCSARLSSRYESERSTCLLGQEIRLWSRRLDLRRRPIDQSGLPALTARTRGVRADLRGAFERRDRRLDCSSRKERSRFTSSMCSTSSVSDQERRWRSALHATVGGRRSKSSSRSDAEPIQAAPRMRFAGTCGSGATTCSASNAASTSSA